MRNVDAHLLGDKMDEAVTHYINSHQPGETVHVDAASLSLNVQDDPGRVVTVMHHGQGFTQMSRQEEGGPWAEELLDPDGRLAALVAHLAHQTRSSHHQTSHHKISSVRGDVDSSVILDNPLRLFNGQHLDNQQEPIVVQVPSLPPLPTLQEMKRCPDSDWFNNKDKNALKNDSEILDTEAPVLELDAGASPQCKQQSRKSLPHKKRISRKLKRNTGNSTPQQDIVVINCVDEVPNEEILPDSYVTAPHPTHLPPDTHIAHEMRPILLCQLCGQFYGEDQLKFYQHLKQHYEPHGTIIIDNQVPVSELAIDKMTNTCIVDNVAALPDSIVELSLENTVTKTMYQPIDKHVLYSGDKALYSNKVQYSMASMDKVPVTSEAEKAELYDTLDKLELYSCSKCNKSFRKQKQCEAHIKEAHSNSKLEDMGEFSEPEDLMEGIHVAVEEEQYEQSLLPHLTVENGQVHQEHVRHWYMRNGTDGPLPCEPAYCPVCPEPPPAQPRSPPARDDDQDHEPQLKEEVLQRIFETEVPTEQNFTESIIPDNEIPAEPTRPQEPSNEDKKKGKKFQCPQCGRIFHHRNSLLYHLLSHRGKQHICRECGKEFYTVGALKIHKRVHNGDRPYKCGDCGREFRQWSDLKYHQVSLHSNQKLFKCEFCGKEFARKYSLNVHRRIHTGERNYKCEFCHKTFRASSYRLSHMRTHTGDRPYKCPTCEKCFRVAGDLRRHMLTHEKVRNRLEEYKKPDKPKKPKDIKAEPKSEPDAPIVKKIAVASTTRPPIKTTDKKPKPPKKSTKKGGAPNVTVSQRSEGFKINTEYTNNVEVFDTRQVEYSKFKEVYSETATEYSKDNLNSSYKSKDYSEQIIGYKESERLNDDTELAILRPMFRNNMCDEEKQVFHLRKTENTDGKMQVFTHVEKKEYPSGLSNTVTLNDIRNLERERDGLNGETMENGFLERLTALYNIPA